jgi:hypothetical protein
MTDDKPLTLRRKAAKESHRPVGSAIEAASTIRSLKSYGSNMLQNCRLQCIGPVTRKFNPSKTVVGKWALARLASEPFASLREAVFLLYRKGRRRRLAAASHNQNKLNHG